MTKEEAIIVEKLLILARSVSVVHHRKTKWLHSTDEDNEGCGYSVDDGCYEDCKGCKTIKERDEVCKQAEELLLNTIS